MATLQRTSVRHRAKFYGDWSNRCADMATFQFVKMAAVRHVRFRYSKFYRLIGLRGSHCVIIPNFMAIYRSLAELTVFQNGGCPPSWILQKEFLTVGILEVAGSPSNTKSSGPRPTSIPSGILVHPAVWPQWTLAENWRALPL